MRSNNKTSDIKLVYLYSVTHKIFVFSPNAYKNWFDDHCRGTRTYNWCCSLSNSYDLYGQEKVFMPLSWCEVWLFHHLRWSHHESSRVQCFCHIVNANCNDFSKSCKVLSSILGNCTMRIPHWWNNSCSVSQEISCTLWKAEFYHRVHHSSQLVPNRQVLNHFL
jgi:hypothetical protein